MTYRELLEILEVLQPWEFDQVMDSDITVRDLSNNEFYPARFDLLRGSDVLDDGHPVLSFRG